VSGTPECSAGFGRTKPPVRDIVADFDRAYPDNAALPVVEVHERLVKGTLALLRRAFDRAELNVYNIAGPTGQHGDLLGTKRWGALRPPRQAGPPRRADTARPGTPLVRDGRIRLLAVTNRIRAAAVPEVPTVTEGGVPVLQMEGILGLYGWRGIPAAVRDELAAQAHQTLADPGVAERLRAAGMEPREASTPAAFKAELVAVRDRWAALAREFGAKPPG
jgi:hypothetical protein